MQTRTKKNLFAALMIVANIAGWGFVIYRYETQLADMQQQIDRTEELSNQVADDVIDIIEGNELGTTDH